MGPARAARATPRERAGRVRDAGERARRPRLGPARARLPRALPRRALVRRALRVRAGRDAGRLRARRPLLGRAVTAAPMAATVFFLWTFFALQREETRTFSAEAQDIARLVYESLDCDAVRAHAGTTTSEVRQRGERLYQVEIAY